MSKNLLRSVSRESLGILRLAKFELIQRYKRSFLGIGWSIITPLITVFVYYLIFWQLLGSQQQNPIQYIIYLISGVIIVNFCIQSITLIGDSFSNKVGLITRIKVNPHKIACSVLVASNLNFIISLVPLILLLFMQGSFSFRLLFWHPV